MLFLFLSLFTQQSSYKLAHNQIGLYGLRMRIDAFKILSTNLVEMFYLYLILTFIFLAILS